MNEIFSEWRRSSYSAPSSNNCVEVAVASGYSAVRDSKNRGLGHLVFPAAEWAAFLIAARRDVL